MNKILSGIMIGVVLMVGLIGCNNPRSPDLAIVIAPTKEAERETAVFPADTPAPPIPQPQPTPTFSGGFGIDYCGDDLAACANLGATWSRHTGVTTAALAQEALDEAQALNMRLILRMNQGDWGWDGRQFDLSILETMRPIFNHPALIGFYGLHEPLERFSLAELHIFYQQYRETIDDPDILLWHDIMRIPDGFEDGICDLCGVAANPHVNDPSTGEPANDWGRTDPRLEEALQNMGDASRSRICVLVQVYGGDGRRFLRMPLPTEYQENVRRIVVDYSIRCLANYAYHHNAYEQTLGNPDQAALQTAVREVGQLYFR